MISTTALFYIGLGGALGVVATVAFWRWTIREELATPRETVDALRGVISCLEDPEEVWVKSLYTLRNRKQDLQVWVDGGVRHVNVYEDQLALRGRDRRRLWKAVTVARANASRRKLGLVCAPEDFDLETDDDA